MQKYWWIHGSIPQKCRAMVADYTATTVARQIWEERSKKMQYQIILELPTSIRYFKQSNLGIFARRLLFLWPYFGIYVHKSDVTHAWHKTMEQTMKPDDDDKLCDSGIQEGNTGSSLRVWRLEEYWIPWFPWYTLELPSTHFQWHTLCAISINFLIIEFNLYVHKTRPTCVCGHINRLSHYSVLGRSFAICKRKQLDYIHYTPRHYMSGGQVDK